MSNTVYPETPAGGAHQMLDMGFHILPLRPNQKIPAVKGWQEWSKTADTGTLMTCPADANYGVHPGLSGHFVVDLDNKKGKNASTVWAALQEKHGAVDPTFTVQTPTGGLHLYFQGVARNTNGELGLGIDTRAADGYVVAPGSIIDDKRYVIIDETSPALSPKWLLELLEPKINQVLDRPAIDQPDKEEHIRAVIEYLESAPVCVDGDPDSPGLYRIFCQVRDRGITLDTARELVLKNYNDRCDPPWDMENDDDAEHFEQKLYNAYNYAQNTLGAKTIEAADKSAIEEFKSAALPDTLDKDAKGLPLLRVADILDTESPKRDWIIDGYLLGSFLSLTGAPGGTGKSNFEILKALAVVTGKPLLGNKVKIIKSGPVVLYNCEDPLDEMIRRVQAFCCILNLSRSDVKDLYLVSGRDHSLRVASVDQKGEVVFNHKAVATLGTTVKSVGAIVMSIDPLVRTHWLNENDNMAMDKVTQAFQRVSSETGCALSIVHHTNKAALNSGSRDSSSQVVFRGAGSLVASARIGHVLTTMNDDEARKLRIPIEKRKFYFKVENAKANLSAPAEYADWYESVGQEISNGETIGVCRPVDLTGQAVFIEDALSRDKRKDGLHFLRANIKTGERVFTNRLRELAIIADCEFADANNTRFISKLHQLIEGTDEFTLVPGLPKKSWTIERREIDFLA